MSAAPSGERKPPFFVIGSPRSGTTMFRLMLNAHSDLAVPFESAFLKLYDRMEEFGDLTQHDNQVTAFRALAEERMTQKGEFIGKEEDVLKYPISDLSSLLDAAFTEFAVREGKQRWGIKTPDYVRKMDQLWHLFPGCQFIHLIRDGRDVAVSLRELSWGTRHMPTLASRWSTLVTLGHKMGGMVRDNYLEVRYEDLVLEPEPTLKTVCEFLQIDFERSMLNYHEDATRNMPEESMQWHASSVAAPDLDKVSGWKRALSPADQVIFEETAGEVLDQFGYPRCGHKAGLATRAKRAYYQLLMRW